MRLTSILLALATAASGMALVTAAPAVAAPAAQTTAVAPPVSTAHKEVPTRASATARSRWYTLRHEVLGPGTFLDASTWLRPSGVRVMQVKARCWGNNSKIRTDLWFLRRWGAGEKIAKSGTWNCNGEYGIVRIHNTGHSKYWATFKLDRNHTVEYWVQYYK